jgi:hypothetical protein
VKMFEKHCYIVLVTEKASLNKLETIKLGLCDNA